MNRRIVHIGMALVLGMLLLALTTTTFSSQRPVPCPPQEQTAAGRCAGPATSAEEDTANPARAVIELRPAP